MSLVTLPRSSAYGQNVKPFDGAKLYFYEAGTTTLKTVYSDKAETIALSNPVIANARGVFAATYISGLYKNLLTDKNDVEVWTEDNLQGRDGELIDQGDFNSSTNSGDYPASGSEGDVYRVTEEFDLNATSGSHTLFVGDYIICNKDGATGIDADWEILLGKNSRQKVVDFSSKNLIISNIANTTIDADADEINLIDSNNQVKHVSDVDLTFTMPTDQLFGTEKASHWYQMWTDSAGLHKLVADLTGTADADVANSLSASAATFTTDGVKAGDIIYNTTDLTQGFVKAVSSETVITCKDAAGADLDLFPDGNETFKIHLLRPTGMGNYMANIGAVYNNAAGNFDNSVKNGQARITIAQYHTANGYGSSSNKIQKYTTEVIASNQEVGDIINSASLGLTITPKMDCKVSISSTGAFTDANADLGISINSTQLTTSIVSIDDADNLAMNRNPTADGPGNVSIGDYQAKKDDVLRPHTSGSANGADPSYARILIVLEEII